MRFSTTLTSCVLFTFFSFIFGSDVSNLRADELTQFGFGKRDITPSLPMRLSGYSNRTEQAKDAVEKLQVRSMVFRIPSGELHAIVSVDLLGLAASHNADIAKRVEAAHKIPRERLVVSCTHTHTGPQLLEPASNLLSTPFSEEERQRALDYAERVIEQIVGVIGDGIQTLQPGKLFLGEGKATFAMNRRTLLNGNWVMIHNPEGLVDHSLPVLKVTDADGKIRGLMFNYACHATTLGPNDNQFNPDWPGFAAKFLEEKYAGATALSLIGCGADANPEPRASEKVKDAVAVAMGHGRAAADGVEKALQGSMTEIKSRPACSFGYAPLVFDLPSAEEFKKRLEDKNVTIRQHAMNMLDILNRKRMLPSTYPLPLQTWQFGNDLTMVFMGGEVVVDYALRLKKELKPGYVWVSAYTNDDPGYVASERVRSEGGYEVDYSMYFYNQPGRWATGTEELIINRIKQLRDNPGAERARTPGESLMMFRLPNGFQIEAVATEPLVMDPINFAFGPDGKLWVVEMADYPLGDDGKPIGRVASLEDTDGDGRFDKRNSFLEGVSYPTGVFPWGDGVIVSAAPEIFLAWDKDGDGKADEKKVLYSGFGEFNPQHRMNGFAYGLDHQLYFAGADPNRLVRAELLNQDIEILGNDFRIDPNSGKIEPEAGRSQFGRSRDDWGHWFGNDNAHPWYHYVIPERAVRRNPHVIFPKNIVDIFGGETPPVFPSSSLAARFNELHTANRFTSACSPILFRDESLGSDVANTGFVCDPVHNLVQQIRVAPEGVTFAGSRIPSDDNREFLASTDNWFRPVRLATGPDGALWVADMYRQVIEHPEWIPDHWQTQLDLRAGADRGRIYRIYRDGDRPGSLPKLSRLSNAELVSQLASPNGTLRDMAQQLLIERKADDVLSPCLTLLTDKSHPASRAQVLWTLRGLGKLTPDVLETSLADSDPRVLIQVIQLCEERFPLSDRLFAKLLSLADQPNEEVRFQLALSLGLATNPSAGDALAKILINDHDAKWIRAAVLSSAVPHAERILTRVLSDDVSAEIRQQFLEPMVSTLIASRGDGVQTILRLVADQDPRQSSQWPLAALSALVKGLVRQQTNLARYCEDHREISDDQKSKVNRWFEKSRQLAVDADAAESEREVAIRLLGRGVDHQQQDLDLLGTLVSPRQSRNIQLAAVESLGTLNAPTVSGLLLANWKQQSPGLQSRIVQVLLSRTEWTHELIRALEEKQVLPSELDATSRLRLTKHTDREIAASASSLLANQVTESRQKVLSEYAAVEKLKGSPQRGAEFFNKKCVACHQFRGQGNAIGANLATLQDRSTRFLLTSILDPNQAVEGKYRSYTAVLNDGRTLSGMVVEESATNITMAASNGTTQTLLRTDIDEFIGNGVSFMPEGLEKDLSPQDMADVISYLQTDATVSGK